MTKSLSSYDHLVRAGEFAGMLDRERTAHPNVDNPQYANRLLAADQGYALRSVVYHGLAAIARAIEEQRR